MNTKSHFASLSLTALACAMALGLSACEKQGPLERAGEEIDEAVDTARQGEESAASKLDDAADEVREGVNEAAEELKKD